MRDVLDIVAQMTRLFEQAPGGAAVLDALREGRMDTDEAMTKLAEIAMAEGHLETLTLATAKLTEAASAHLESPVTMYHDNGLEMLNPLMEAAIAERASLDGDVPELRSGPLPEDGHPAVPVLTDTMDPVVLGMQLEKAAAEVAEEISLRVTAHSESCALILSDAESAAIEEGLDVALVMRGETARLPAIPTGVKGYETGSVPALRVASVIPTATLAALTDEQRRHYSYKALSTTQGRTSLNGVIQQGVIHYLRAHGIIAVAGEPHPDTTVTARWAAVVWGAEDLAEEFNPITTAIHSMCSDVMESITGHAEVFVRVSPHHGITDRRFGWNLVVGPKERTT
jgi:hypothetical protein